MYHLSINSESLCTCRSLFILINYYIIDISKLRTGLSSQQIFYCYYYYNYSLVLQLDNITQQHHLSEEFFIHATCQKNNILSSWSPNLSIPAPPLSFALQKKVSPFLHLPLSKPLPLSFTLLSLIHHNPFLRLCL